MNIYELTSEWSNIQSELIEAGGELTPELEGVIDQLEQATDAKAESYASVIKNLDALVNARKTEAKRLTDSARSISKNITEMKQRLVKLMQESGSSKIATGKFTLSLRKAGGKQRMIVADVVPSEFIETVQVDKVSIAAIRAKLESGEELEFASLAPRTISVTIK